MFSFKQIPPLRRYYNRNMLVAVILGCGSLGSLINSTTTGKNSLLHMRITEFSNPSLSTVPMSSYQTKILEDKFSDEVYQRRQQAILKAKAEREKVQ